MPDEKERDHALFLTTLERWNQQAFMDAIARGPGALAALEVVPHESDARRGVALNEALGDWVSERWPAVISALAEWSGAVAQRGGWSLIWAFAPGAEVKTLGAALAGALAPREGLAQASLIGKLVVVPVAGTGNTSADVAIRAAEDELHGWHHGTSAIEFRWSDAPSSGA